MESSGSSNAVEFCVSLILWESPETGEVPMSQNDPCLESKNWDASTRLLQFSTLSLSFWVWAINRFINSLNFSFESSSTESASLWWSSGFLSAWSLTSSLLVLLHVLLLFFSFVFQYHIFAQSPPIQWGYWHTAFQLHSPQSSSHR